MKDQKKLLRELKRQTKKDGNRSRRRQFQRDLDKDPEHAHESEFEFNEYNTSTRYQRLDGEKDRSYRGRLSEFAEESGEIEEEYRDAQGESGSSLHYERVEGTTDIRINDTNDLRSTETTGGDTNETGTNTK